MGPYDVLIAGQARARQLTLVTHSTAEFTRVRGLKVEDWSRATSSTPTTRKGRRSPSKPRAQ